MPFSPPALVHRWLLTCLYLLGAGSVLAHEGGPRLIVHDQAPAAGDTVEVSGANLGSDLVVEIILVAGGETRPLGEVLCDGHGDFTAVLKLPPDLLSGIHSLQAVDHSLPGQPAVMAALDIRIVGLLVRPTGDIPFAADPAPATVPNGRSAAAILMTLVVVLAAAGALALAVWRKYPRPQNKTEPRPSRSP